MSHRGFESAFRDLALAASVASLIAGCAALTGGDVGRRPAGGGDPTGEPFASGPEAGRIPLFVRTLFRPLPDKMPGSEGDTQEMVALGRRLYFERGISDTRTQSCNDCHRLDGGFAGVDGLPTSPGAKGARGKRNSPTVLNAGFNARQFWDGRAAGLVEQAKGPILNRIEMAMCMEGEVVKRLKELSDYPRQFAAAFPNQPDGRRESICAAPASGAPGVATRVGRGRKEDSTLVHSGFAITRIAGWRPGLA